MKGIKKKIYVSLIPRRIGVEESLFTVLVLTAIIAVAHGFEEYFSKWVEKVWGSWSEIEETDEDVDVTDMSHIRYIL